MEGGDGSGFDAAHMKRRRSSGARRPRQDGGATADQWGNTSPSSSSMSSRSGSKRLLPSDEIAAGPDGGIRRREFHLNAPSPERATHGGNRPRSEAAHVPEGNRGSSSTGEKPRKLKLKISRNVLLKPDPDTSDSRSSPAKPPRPGDSHQQKHGNLTEGSKDSDRSTSSRDRKTRKVRSIEKTLAQEQPAKVQREPSSEPVRKSRRLAKKSILDSELDEDYDISNLENPGTSEDMEGYTEDMEGYTPEPENKGGSSSKKNASKKAKGRSRVFEVDNDLVMIMIL
uniref:Uncharacterized protein n=1 Tax=Arundo donax TaxID=35708 RepID=A0A0A9DQ33_ARUDO